LTHYIYGTWYSEELRGTDGNDVIYGYGGHDLLNGRDGNDVLFGDNGDDDIIGNTGFNDLYGGRGYDIFYMVDRGDGFSDDLIYDFEFKYDQIDVSHWGVSDFSQIAALLTTDSTGSATFNASYFGEDHVLTIDGVRPNQLRSIDFLYDLGGRHDQTGAATDDVLFGSVSGDALDGRAGNDRLLGGQGNDTLTGDDGSDHLYGGAGADVMTGNGGNDFFVFDHIYESPGGAGRDRIAGFQQGADKIDVSDIDAQAASGFQHFVWHGAGGFTGAGQLVYNTNGNYTIVSGNTDNDPSAEFQIVLTGHFNLTQNDFIL